MKSSIQWLSLSDRNTKFLQTTTLNNIRKNKIQQLLKDNNTWITDQSEIEREMRNHLISTFADDNNLNDNYLNSFQF